MKVILITGINGVIGKIISPALSKKYEVYGLDSRGPFSDKTFEVNISGFDDLSSRISHFSSRLSAIIHLAAASDHLSPWPVVLENNIIGTKNIFDIALRFKIKHVLFASSTHAFGLLPGYPNLDFETLPNSPEISFAPDSFYGASKAFGETLAKYYQQEHGLNFSIIRIGSVTPTDDLEPDAYRHLHLYHHDLANIITGSLESTVPYEIVWGISKGRD